MVRDYTIRICCLSHFSTLLFLHYNDIVINLGCELFPTIQ